MKYTILLCCLFIASFSIAQDAAIEAGAKYISLSPKVGFSEKVNLSSTSVFVAFQGYLGLSSVAHEIRVGYDVFSLDEDVFDETEETGFSIGYLGHKYFSEELRGFGVGSGIEYHHAKSFGSLSVQFEALYRINFGQDARIAIVPSVSIGYAYIFFDNDIFSTTGSFMYSPKLRLAYLF